MTENDNVPNAKKRRIVELSKRQKPERKIMLAIQTSSKT